MKCVWVGIYAVVVRIEHAPTRWLPSQPCGQYLCHVLQWRVPLDMSDTESHDQRPTPPCEPRAPVRQESPGIPVSSREQARLADLQRCIDSMRKVAGDMDARLADLECSVGRIHAAFGQMSGLHEMVTGRATRGGGGQGGYHTDRGNGGRRDLYNRQDGGPQQGGREHVSPPFGNGGGFGGRGRARRQ